MVETGNGFLKTSAVLGLSALDPKSNNDEELLAVMVLVLLGFSGVSTSMATGDSVLDLTTGFVGLVFEEVAVEGGFDCFAVTENVDDDDDDDDADLDVVAV